MPTAFPAIKGTVPDPAGETYGVIGISNSPDGAGMAAANTAGGPDLVLDGSEDLLADAEFSESGINRPSGAPQSFSFSNTGGGGAVHWGNLTSVPPGFADGVDNEASISAGLGIIIDHHGEIRIDLDFFLTQISRVDFDSDVGWFSSITIGADVLALISCLDAANGDLMVAHCFNTICSLSDLFTLDSGGDVGEYSSIATGNGDFGLISYYDTINGELKVARCLNRACTKATNATVDFTLGTVHHGLPTSIAIGADGFGIISYGGAVAHLGIGVP